MPRFRNFCTKMNCSPIVLFLSVSCILSNVNGEEKPLCSFVSHKTKQSEMHRRLQPLLGQRFETKDDSQAYNYNIGICTNAVPDNKFGINVGVVQNKANPNPTVTTSPNHWIIGYYNNSQLIEGTDWLILEYNGGQPYHSHCSKESRKARIMITCDEKVKLGDEKVKVIEEETDKFQDCYYLFEIGTSVVCEKKPVITVSLSVGSILLITFIVVVFLYGVLGFVYMRLVLGAKGKEQIPNYSFWKDFGNLQADGCNLLCRSESKSESRPYKGIGDDQLQEEDDRDDHLLPM